MTTIIHRLCALIFLMTRFIRTVKHEGIFIGLLKVRSVFIRWANKSKYHKWFSTQQAKVKYSKLTATPLISIVVPTYNTPIAFLDKMIQSIINQHYTNWELCIADGSDALYMQAALSKYKDSRIKIKFLERNLHISGNTNEALNMISGEYVGFMDHDDLLAPNCLYEFVKAINELSADMLYCDEDIIDINDKHIFPHFKPDWSPHLLLSYNYITHFLVISNKILRKIGGLSSKFNGAQDYDFVLRASAVAKNIVHIPQVLYHWRSHSQSSASNPYSKSYAHEAGLNAVQTFIAPHMEHANVFGAPNQMFVYRIQRSLNSNIKITLMLMSNNSHNINILQTFNNHSNYQLLTLNDIPSDNLSVPQIRNRVIEHATGDIIVFVNDMVKMTNDWLIELAAYSLDDKVGVVSPLLLNTNKTINHAGIVMGMPKDGCIFANEYPISSTVPFVSNMAMRNVLAVSSQCFAISKNAIQQIGLFNENCIHNDEVLEICIRAYKNGLFNIYNPQAIGYTSCNINIDYANLMPNVSNFINHDPFFNPNLCYLARHIALNE